MPRIRLLPPHIISRIAAGEVVERPASVVKELVENSLDAGAAHIAVETLDGGRELIRVIDDGCGMDAEDLQLSVQQHATSKIANDDDLFRLSTMGFRGEALASIGAVARLEITSRTRDADVAHCLRLDAGELTPPQPCNAKPGTTIAVRDLFMSAPARRKFLRTNQTESGHITEQFARIALAQPRVAFSLKSQGRLVHELPASDDRRQRIADLYGVDLADVLLPIRREGRDVLIEGLVAPPQESRGSGKWEYVFVNGRYVRDRFVTHAVREGYRSLIDPRRYPVAFLFITIHPEAVDVNVHPMKTEVRWRDSNYVHGQVLAALRETFQTRPLDHALQAGENEHRERVRQAMVDFFRAAAPPRSDPQTDHTPTKNGASPIAPHPPRDTSVHHAAPPHAHQQPTPQQVESPSPASGAASPDAELPGLLTPADANARPSKALQIHDSYLLVETGDGLMIIDQHALHERILYEELSQRVKERPLAAQRLLLPEVVRAPADRLEVLETHADLLARLGVELNIAGPQSVALQAFPTLLSERGVDQRQFVSDLLDLLSEKGAQPDADTLVHDVLDMLACKAAVKAGEPLTADEIDALLARRTLAERSSHCPHGRPTTLHFALRDLEKQFHRR